MVWFLALVLTGLAGSTSAHDTRRLGPAIDTARPAPAVAQLASDTRRVRAMDERAAQLLDAGVHRSPTFAGLVTALHDTDVIVYIETTDRLPATMGGRLLLQAVTPHERYVRVQVRARLRQNEGIEVMAHELRHALEVATEASVIDEAGFVALYERIGYRSRAHRGFDTDAARRTGETVRQELRG